MKTNKFFAMVMTIIMVVTATVSSVSAEEYTQPVPDKNGWACEYVYQESTGHMMIYVGFKGELITTIAVKDGTIFDLDGCGYVAKGELKDMRSVCAAYGNWDGVKVTHNSVKVVWTGKDGNNYISDLGWNTRLLVNNPKKYPHNELNRTMEVAQTSFKVPEPAAK